MTTVVAVVAMVALGCSDSDDNNSSGGSSGGNVQLVDTQWVLDQEASTLEVIAPQARVTATFDGSRMSGTGGCNNYSTSYTLDGSKMTIGPVASTLIACPPPASNVEAAYSERLPQVRSYAISGPTLTLTTSTRGADLVYRALGEGEALNGEWEATSFFRPGAITSVITGSTITATFDNGKLSGNAGCNTYNATYEVDGSKIAIGPIASTRRACLDGLVATQEAEYLAALELARTYSLGANGLTLLRDGGTIAVTYAPA